MSAILRDLVEEVWSADDIERLWRSGARSHPNEFRQAFHALLGGRGELLLSTSGRQALATLLEKLKTRSRARKVFLCSFNCAVVREAVTRNGFAVETFDLADGTGRIDWAQIAGLLNADHLAVIVPHLFGIPSDFRPALDRARALGIYVIEDCAHTLGGKIAGDVAGTLGDAAIFSFNYDKPLSLSGGGALLINNPAIAIQAKDVEVVPPARSEYHQFQHLCAYLHYRRSRTKHPRIVSRIGNKLGMSPYALPRIPAGIGAFRATVGLWQIERWANTLATRTCNAILLSQASGGADWHIGAEILPAPLKMRVAIAPSRAQDIIQTCREADIVVANSNWPCIIDPINSAARPHATRAAREGMDMPVHQRLNTSQLATLSDCLRPR
jgi:dTDP-4-amino-4,6-dideoxygalactose transaminase